MCTKKPSSVGAYIGIFLLALAPLYAHLTNFQCFGVAQADSQEEDYPSREMLAENQLEEFLNSWDAALATNDLGAILEVLDEVSYRVPEGYGLAGLPMLHYDNPEIEERVISLYMAERENLDLLDRGATMADIGIEVPEFIDEDNHFDEYGDYLETLARTAELTFSPEIYDQVLRTPLTGSVRRLYLATVNPERTLELLLQATSEKDMNAKTFPTVLELPGSFRMTIESALKLLTALCDRSPEAVAAEQDRVLGFVHRYSLQYAEPVEVSYRSEPRYLSALDYRLRNLALQTLDLLAETADIYNVVDDVMRDAPKPPHGTGPNEIIRKGEELLERVQSMD